MEHHAPLITTLAAAFGGALIFGLLAERLKIPALLGYIFAGILIGPATPGFVADTELASQLAEIGVMLLMFGVGLHFSLADLLAVRRIAVPGAIVQMGGATLLGFWLASQWQWPFGEALLFGLALSCASTVVLLKALDARNLLTSSNGRIAVGWLVVEDLATVLVLVLLPPLASLLGGSATASTSAAPWWQTIARTLLEVGAFIALMLLVGRKAIPWMLWQVAGTGSRELFTLAVIATAIGIAFGAAQLFSVSFALGAFFAGMVMRESKFSHRAAEESLPLRDAFSVLFFVSVGMLFQPAILLEQPLRVLAVVAIIILGKALAAGALVLAFRYPLNTALTVAASLAQIGEFSFILAGVGQSLGLLNQEGMSLILAGALLSIGLNPLLFSAIEPLRRWALANSALARRLEARRDPLAALPQATARDLLRNQIVIAGYGPLGQHLLTQLRAQQQACIVAEARRELVERLRAEGVAAVAGDVADSEVLIQAHIAEAAALIITPETLVAARQMLATARSLNPDLLIVAAASTTDEAELLRQEGITHVIDASTAQAMHIISTLDRAMVPMASQPPAS